MADHSDITRFDAYLRDEMTHAEMRQFEADLKSDAQLLAAFEGHKRFLAEFGEGVEYRETQKQLNSIHQSLYNPQPNFFLSRQFLVPVAIAACFILAMLAINPTIFTGGDGAQDNDNVAATDTMAYSEQPDAATTAPTNDDTSAGAVTESADTAAGPGSDDSLAMNLEWEEYFKKLWPNPVHYTGETDAGTAFMISADGYFITSKHILGKQQIVMLRRPTDNLAFNAEVIYADSLTDLAILKCHTAIATTHLTPVPLTFFHDSIHANQPVIALGYYNGQLMKTEGFVRTGPDTVSADNGVEIEIGHQTGYRGAPVFTKGGALVATLGKNNHQTRVTYAQDVHYILAVLENLEEQNRFSGLERNKGLKAKPYASLSKRYGPFLYEVHPRY
jgi:hypothetical protein